MTLPRIRSEIAGAPARAKKICFVVADPLTAKVVIPDQIAALSRHYDVMLASGRSWRSGVAVRDLHLGVDVLPLPMDRKISPLRDVVALVRLARALRHQRFDAIHSITPKAGLIAMLAGAVARVPRRTHTFTGQLWATRSGVPRLVLKTLDRLIAALATHVLVDSQSQRSILLQEKIIRKENSAVFCRGSVSGVDTARFRPDPAGRAEVRRALGISEDATVFLFVGRLNRDKGVRDLATAFARVAAASPDVHLILVGPDEEQLRPVIRAICADCSERVHMLDFVDAPEHYTASCDVFCLPSYREGFPSVLLQAAAAGVPAIASRIYGNTDAVEDGETGLLHEAGNVDEIADKMRRVLQDPGLRRMLGEQAQRRARQYFSQELLTTAWLEYYRSAWS